MITVRESAVAGQFYPADATQLKNVVDQLLRDAPGPGGGASVPKVLVAPHAGYIYSGSVAAQGYTRVARGAAQITRVVLLGPSHRVAFSGIATSSATFYASPLGQVPLDLDTMRQLSRLSTVTELDQAHAQEHSLEVHLPFLQRCLNKFSLVPLVVGQADPAAVAQVLDVLWGGPETLIVVSSDLSHFLPYEQAQVKDAQTSRLIEARDSRINGEQACGCRPLNGLLEVLKQRGLGISTVVVNNSGDTAGDRERVVGYGSYVVEGQVVDGQVVDGQVVEGQAVEATDTHQQSTIN